MSNDNNESDEAYARRQHIKALMEAPRGTRFESKYRNETDDAFVKSPTPTWSFYDLDYRIAPSPKEVLRPAWEILIDAQEASYIDYDDDGWFTPEETNE